MRMCETPWLERRVQAARRFRAIVIACGALLAVNAGMWTISALDSVGSYRLIHVPGATSCGRARPVDREEAARIMTEFDAVGVATASRTTSGSDPTLTEGDHAQILAHAARR